MHSLHVWTWNKLHHIVSPKASACTVSYACGSSLMHSALLHSYTCENGPGCKKKGLLLWENSLNIPGLFAGQKGAQMLHTKSSMQTLKACMFQSKCKWHLVEVQRLVSFRCWKQKNPSATIRFEGFMCNSKTDLLPSNEWIKNCLYQFFEFNHDDV